MPFTPPAPDGYMTAGVGCGAPVLVLKGNAMWYIICLESWPGKRNWICALHGVATPPVCLLFEPPFAAAIRCLWLSAFSPDTRSLAVFPHSHRSFDSLASVVTTVSSASSLPLTQILTGSAMAFAHESQLKTSSHSHLQPLPAVTFVLLWAVSLSFLLSLHSFASQPLFRIV